MITDTVLSASIVVVLILCHVGVDVTSAQGDCTPPCQFTSSCATDNTCDCQGTSFTGDTCDIECPDQCITCNDTNPLICTECSLTYYVNTTTWNCQACADENCLICETDGLSCTTCDLGFYSTGGDCKPCADDKCLVCGSDGLSCDTCDLGFYSSGGVCEPCIDNCAECSDDNSCDKCDEGFFVDVEDGTCQPCGQFCLECDNAQTCTKCAKSKYFNEASGTCQSCGKYCNDCYSPGRCANCKDGSRKIEAGRKAFCTDPRNKCRRRKYYMANRETCFPFMCINSRQFIMKHRSRCQRFLCWQRWYQLSYPVRCATWKRRGFQEVPRYPFGSMQY